MDTQAQDTIAARLESNTMKKPTYACNICKDKYFTTRASQRRHNSSFHEKQQTKYQCWTCFKTYVRKESVIKHSKKAHDDSDKKFVIVTSTNTAYNPGIFKPDPWTPPPEARTRNKPTTNATIFKVKVQSACKTAPPPVSTPVDINPHGLPSDWEPLSLAQLAVRYPVSTEQLMEELRITPSSSDETICLDETENREEISHVKVYNVFKD